VLVSCGGTPDPAAPTEPEPENPSTQQTQASSAASTGQKPGKDALDAMNSARDRAEENRKKALDVQGQVYFPNEWKNAEEAKNKADNDAKKNTPESIDSATASYIEAADGYEDIVKNSEPLYAKDMEDALKALQSAIARADQSKQQAQDAQAPVYFPKDWQAAETVHQNGKDAKKETLEEIKAAADMYTQAADKYDDAAGKSRPLLAKEKDDALAGLNAAIARMEQSRKDAQDAQGPVYFPKDWQNAEAQNKAGKDAKKTTTAEIKAAAALYTRAADSYDDIAGKSRPLAAKEKNDALAALNAAKARAEQSRKNAQDAQAPVYFPKDWQAAETKNKAGQDAKKDSVAEMKAAAALYTQAADGYDAITSKSRAQAAKEKDDALQSLNAAMARAEQSRKNAQDAQAPAYFPNDWKNAEAKNDAGKAAKKTSIEEIKAAAALYTQAADAYDDVAGKSRPLLAKDREDADKALQAAMARAEQSRKNAQDAQAPTYFPNDWKNAEAKTAAGKAAKKTTPEEIKSAAALYIQAADAYDDMVNRNASRLTKEEEDARNALQSAIARMEQSRKNAQDAQGPVYFPKDWQTAEAQNKAGQNAKKQTPEEIKAAAALYTQAADSYDDIAAKSRPLLAKDREDADKALQAAMARAEQSRKNAQDAQGPVYFPKDWQNAEAKNDAGKNAKKTTTEEIKAATALYTQAADTYDDIANKTRTQLAKEKEDALKALNAAMARAEQSRKNAQDAQAPAYFPNDWKNAEAKNDAGKNAKKDSIEEMKSAAALYAQAADAYDDIAGRSRTALADQDKDAALKALQEAMARAEQSRKNAQDAQAPAYFPNDWKNAEAKNDAGKNAKKTTPEEIRAAAALYTQAADAYDDLTGKTRTAAAQQQQERDAAQKALQEAMARAEQSRKQAEGFQGATYAPNDWKNAEAKNDAGKAAKKQTPEDIRSAAALYAQAADAYDAIVRQSRPRYIQDWEDALKRERAAAVSAGIGSAAPDQLTTADKTAEEIRRDLASADYVPDKDTVSLPIDMYRALKPRAEGYHVRQEIVDQGLADADPDNMAAGDRYTAGAIQDYEAKNPKDAYAKANDALDRYNAVLQGGKLAEAQKWMLEASKERQIAVDVKAPVAVWEDFNEADTVYQQALSDFNEGRYESAMSLYQQSAVQFIAAAQAAEEKRRRAEEAIAAAKQKRAESTALAESAGLIMEGNNE
jgi:hypothetical protein